MPCGYLEPISVQVQDEEEQVSESAASDLGTCVKTCVKKVTISWYYLHVCVTY